MIDLIYSQDIGQRPDVIITDTGSYKLWRILASADYRPLNAAARGKIDLARIERQYVDDEPYRREIKGMRNLQEGRHALACTMFHGRKGELRHGYREGMEDRLGAPGLILNTLTLWNTVYLDHAIEQLRADGYPVRACAERPSGPSPGT